ncbi:MAG: hypothetical protein EXQ90_08060 [Rhodospirillales bacterium]|nr:hypothetical protein [Rhodospirillales bacterium]
MVVRPPGILTFAGRRYRCALGRSGIVEAKHEGDGGTPTGRFPLRRVYYRPDRIAPPVTALPVQGLMPADGWSDDPTDPNYNRLVFRPRPTRSETLWRDDAVYDVIVEIGFNDDPPVAGHGSAIFIHVARADFEPTEGCVALAIADLRDLLGRISPNTACVISSRPEPA